LLETRREASLAEKKIKMAVNEEMGRRQIRHQVRRKKDAKLIGEKCEVEDAI